ncbi:Hint domain-containing protein [Lutimaribacter marinistellae]|uniref:Hint domain-containing protein n=1 Tax=Lutimaribacter marinistellae TaxID=1820329 RepID=A0ABV7TP31_9RHOB
MATNFDNPYSANLIGLWDFRTNFETNDTGLDDGIAQDGTPVDSPDFSAGWMFTGAGDSDRMDIDDGDDEPFDLDEGTIIASFRPFGFGSAVASGGSPTPGNQTVVSRGVEQSAGQAEDRGFFEMRVTPEGRVEVVHRDGDAEQVFGTSDGFFNDGDVVTATYTFSSEGTQTFSVVNETQGTSEQMSGEAPGLTLDIAEETEQSFSLAAREATDGNFDQNFFGGIDYVAVLDAPVNGGGLNGIVDGTPGDDDIDLGYTGDPEGDRIDNMDAIDPSANPNDDVVNAGDGDDMIDGADEDDDIYGGGGDDTATGGPGDDLIDGDGTAPGAGTVIREAFLWNEGPIQNDGVTYPDGEDLSGGVTQDTGNANVTFSVLTGSPGTTTEFDTVPQHTNQIDTDGPGANPASSLNSVLDGPGTATEYQLEFDRPVTDVSFRINDIDGSAGVRVTAFDEADNPITVNLGAGPRVMLSDTDAVPGADTGVSTGGFQDPIGEDYSMLVTIPGPVSRFVIEQANIGPEGSTINVTDVYFDVAQPFTGGGAPGDDSLDGGDGNDTLIGREGDDTLTGGEGQDSVDGGDGDDLIETGRDPLTELPDRGFPSYDGLPAVPADPDVMDDRDTVDGGDGNDTISTGDDNDMITGGAGMDLIDGGLDDDTIDGGTGDDTLIGSEGADSIIAGDGADVVYGGLDPSFPDRLNIRDDGSDGRPADPETTNGDDTIDGGAGDDTIFGQDDTDVITGGEGDDLIDAGIDNDIVDGGTGNDTITGGHGADLLAGGDDRDTFLGGDNGDQVDGGSGGDDFDTLDLRGLGPIGVIYTSPDEEDGIAVIGDTGGVVTFEEIETVLIDDPLEPDGIVEGTFDDDIIDLAYDGDPNGDFVDNDDAILPGQVGDDDIIIAKTGDDAILSGDGNDNVFAGAGDDTAYGDDGDDTVRGQEGDDVLEGNAGDDQIHGGDGDDALDAGRGNDTMFGDAGNDVLTGNPGDDVLDGGDGDDTIIGNDGSDTLSGGAGNDTISTGPGEDVASGGDDRDTFIVVGQNDQFVDGNEGGDDFDTLIVFGNAEVEYDPTNIENGTVFYLDDADVRTGVTTTFINIEEVIIRNPQIDGVVEGGDGADLIDASYTGDPEGDVIDGFDALENFLDQPIDSLVPSDFFEDLGGTPRGDQRDAVDAGDGDDTVFSGAGDDIVKGRGGDDLVYAGFGFDDVAGGAGNDTLDGQEGDDKLFGEDGDDLLIGGFGDDTLLGGDGSDTVEAGLGRNFVQLGAGDDLATGGDNADTIEAGDGADTVFAGGGDDSVLAYDPAFTGVASIGRSPDFVDGGAGDDRIGTGSGDDVVMGGTGNDEKYGGIGADQMDGGAGNDTIFGDSDPDTAPPADIAEALTLEPGNDTLTGGDGDDEIHGQDGNDSIDGGGGDDLLAGGISGDTILGGAGNDTIYGGDAPGVPSLAPSLEDSIGDSIDGGDGDDSVIGSDFNDTITGGAGADNMSGGAGRDLFIGGNDGDIADGGTDGDDFDTLDLTGIDFEIASRTLDPDGDSFSGTINFLAADGSVEGSMEYREIEEIIPCFTPGTRIATPKGERLVEELEVGDRIITRDNGIQEIKWLGRRDLASRELTRAPHLQPVLIRQGALGGGLPERDMLVSPNHRILVANDKTALYFEEREVLVAAKHLTGLEGVDKIEVGEVSYIHFMFEQHEVVLSDGAWTESFQPGDQTLASMGDAQREEIYELFPELAETEGLEAYTAARRSLKKHEARLLL